MRETNPHISKQYVREGGFPLVGAIVRFFGKNVSNKIEVEAELQAQRSREARQGKVIGKPWKAPVVQKKQSEVDVKEVKQDADNAKSEATKQE